MSIRIMIVDDSEPLREILRSLLSAQEDLELVGEAADGAEAVALAERVHPDVVVLDVSMPRMNGIEAARSIRSRLPEVRVIMLTLQCTERAVRDALEAGARAFLLKESVLDDLHHAVHAVMSGRCFFSSNVALPAPAFIRERCP